MNPYGPSKKANGKGSNCHLLVLLNLLILFGQGKAMAIKSAIVLGAGPAGLACAAMLKSHGILVTIVEKEATICPVWHAHYDRLRLHTDKSHSSLPGYPISGDAPKYLTKSQVIDYCENYAAHFGLEPILGCSVENVRRDGNWKIRSSNGDMEADIVVMATGMASFPYLPNWPGLEEFEGVVIHSCDYKNPLEFVGSRVLVVGFGNSGGEIALDLANANLNPRLSVRGPVNIVPKEIFGISILTLSILQQSLPYKVADFINKPVLRMVLGDTKRLGLQAAGKGPMAQVVEDGKIPLLDIGTLKALREGSIHLLPGILRVDNQAVTFVDGHSECFDAIILGTGYRPDLRGLLSGMDHLLDDSGLPRQCGAVGGQDGLYFCGYRASPTGQLRQIGIEAQQIADAVVAS